MSVEVIDAQAIPQSSFVRRSRILDTKEYKDTLAALPGIKAGKALRVTLSAETCAVAKNAAFAFKRHLVAHIKESKLKLEDVGGLRFCRSATDIGSTHSSAC